MTHIAPVVRPPTRAALRQALEDVVRREVTLANSTPLAVDPPHLCAVFTDAHLQLTDLVVLDVGAIYTLAGPVLRRSSTWVRQQVHADQQDKRVRDALETALDGLVPALQTRHADRPVHLYGLHGRHTRMPTDIPALARSPRARDDVAFTVPGYGRGHLSIVLA